jgi:hypothetical protein
MSASGSSSRLWRRLLALAASMFLSAAAAEVFARACLPPPQVQANQILDPEFGFTALPCAPVELRDERGAYFCGLNSLGFRGPELPAQGAEPSARRILLVGDSFIQAWFVREEEWVGGSVRSALAAAGTPVEAYSLGVSDYGTAQELMLLRRHGRRVRPSVVALFLYPGNDLLNNAPELAGWSSNSPGDYFRPYLVPDGAGGLERRYALPQRALLRHSRLFSTLEARWLRGRSEEELRAELMGTQVRGAKQRNPSGLPEHSALGLFLPPTPGDAWDAAWRTTEALVCAARDEAKDLGARFVVVVIPHMLQVQRNFQSASYEELQHPADREPSDACDWSLPERRLEDFFHREKIDHVQLLDALRRSVAETHSSRYTFDGHLGGPAHVEMGRALAARLAPGARDQCFVGTEPRLPIDLLAERGAPPIHIDLSRHPCVEAFGSGWLCWSPGSNGQPAGVPLIGQGYFLARPGFVTLRGTLPPWTKFPAELCVARAGQRFAVLGRERVEAPGEFAFSFLLEDEQEAWLPLRLWLVGNQSTDYSRPKLTVSALTIEREPSADWVAKNASAGPTNVGRKLGRRIVQILLPVFLDLTTYLQLRIVVRRA